MADLKWTKVKISRIYKKRSEAGSHKPDSVSSPVGNSETPLEIQQRRGKFGNTVGNSETVFRTRIVSQFPTPLYSDYSLKGAPMLDPGSAFGDETLTKLILDCINENLEGDFHREHHVHDHHVKIYSEEQADRIKTIIQKISIMLNRHYQTDCTQFFNYTNVQYY